MFEMDIADVRGCLYIDEISNHRDGHGDDGQVQPRRAQSKSVGRVSISQAGTFLSFVKNSYSGSFLP